MEKWLEINGYEDYKISNYGNVISLKFKKIKFLALVPTSTTKYFFVKLTKNHIEKTFAVHRLVAQTFIDNPLNKSEVNHIDGNKFNNKVENLEWVTKSENQLHAYRTHLKDHEKVKKASIANFKIASEFNKQKVLISKNDIQLRFNSQKEANEYIGCNKCGVYSVLKGQATTVYGWSVQRI